MTIPTTPYQPSPRVQRLRQRMLEQDASLFWGKWLQCYYFLEGWMASDRASLTRRTAEAFAHVVAGMPVKLHDDEILVGEHGFDTLHVPFSFGRYGGLPSWDYLHEARKSPLTPEQLEQLDTWIQDDPSAWKSLTNVEPSPEAYQLGQAHGVFWAWGCDLGHSIRDYAKVLRLGFSGIKAAVVAALDALPITDPMAAQQRDTLQAWLRVCDAAMTLGARYAEAARTRADASANAQQRDAWRTIADICDRVPAHPARTFREAVQALWFAHILTAWEDGLNANGLGRIDQFLWPYLQQDLANGTTTPEEAAEVLAALWCKLYFTYDVQQMMIGGQTLTGEDATNLLSYLVLDVTEGLGFIRCLSARVHNGSPRDFVARCLELVAHGGGIPFFFNDEALIPALTANGIALDDARDYAAIGCIEVTIPGKALPHAVSNWINLAKCLELAVNDGCDLLTGKQLGPHTGTLADFTRMDDVLVAFTTQFDYWSAWAAYGSNRMELEHRFQYRLPYHSLLTDDCIARGMDLVEGGAKYNYHSSAAVGIPNVADSLAALDLAVFTEQRVSGAALLQALRENFQGQDDLCAYLRHRMPKYGNDNELPDRYAADLVTQYCTRMGSLRTVSGGTFFAHLFTFTMMLDFGRITGAAPEGRTAGEPLAYSVSPVQGRDRGGLTAVMNSLARLPHHLVAASSSAILEAEPTLFTGPGEQAMVDLMCTAIRQGIGQLQFNVVSADTLRAAQREPERYRNLSVRVSGFSQHFGLLSPEMQEHIIARTKHRQ